MLPTSPALYTPSKNKFPSTDFPLYKLNLSKVLEVLFPPKGSGKTRDAVRAGLLSLGFSETEIEADYIPAMALRNEIDVGHVDLSLFKADHLALIHGFTEHAETTFRNLLKRLFERLASDDFEITQYDPAPASGKAVEIVKRIKEHAERYNR